MVGLEGRTSLLVNLSKALSSNPEFFGQDARPGNLVGEGNPRSQSQGFTRVDPKHQISLRKSRKYLKGKHSFRSPPFGMP